MFVQVIRHATGLVAYVTTVGSEPDAITHVTVYRTEKETKPIEHEFCDTHAQGVACAERVMRDIAVERLAWRTPLHAMQLFLK